MNDMRTRFGQSSNVIKRRMSAGVKKYQRLAEYRILNKERNSVCDHNI